MQQARPTRTLAGAGVGPPKILAAVAKSSMDDVWSGILSVMSIGFSGSARTTADHDPVGYIAEPALRTVDVEVDRRQEVDSW